MASKLKKPRVLKPGACLVVAPVLSNPERRDISKWLRDLAKLIRNGKTTNDRFTAELKYY